MARRRLGVVLVVPPPLGDAVDGLRRAFGDPMLDRVVPHVTLVPPVNVADRDLSTVLATLRRAAGQARTLPLTLGPVAAFDGHEGVAYLGVGGEAVSSGALAGLRRGVLSGPLDRPIDHDFVPHATVTQGVDPQRLAAVLGAAAGWTPRPWTVERVTLLEERHLAVGRRWVPVAEVALAPPMIVGRGGLELELTPSAVLDPEASLVLADAGVDLIDQTDQTDQTQPSSPSGPEALTVVARREGRVAGVVVGSTWGAASAVTRLWVAPEAARQGIEDHLVAVFASAAADRDAGPPPIRSGTGAQPGQPRSGGPAGR